MSSRAVRGRLKFSIFSFIFFYLFYLDKSKDEIKGRKFVAKLNEGEAENELRKHLDQKDFLSGQFELIGQFNLGFIVVRLLQDDLFIVDQHASDEKFRFESLTKKVKRVTQPLVIPKELRLDAGKREILKSNLTVLESQGTFFFLFIYSCLFISFYNFYYIF